MRWYKRAVEEILKTTPFNVDDANLFIACLYSAMGWKPLQYVSKYRTWEAIEQNFIRVMVEHEYATRMRFMFEFFGGRLALADLTLAARYQEFCDRHGLTRVCDVTA